MEYATFLTYISFEFMSVAPFPPPDDEIGDVPDRVRFLRIEWPILNDLPVQILKSQK